MKPKVVVIFPRFDQQDGSHYPYWYDLFEKAGKSLELAVVYESTNKQSRKNFQFSILRHTQGKFFNFQIQHISLKPVNIIERLILLIKLRVQGYTHFYVHYSIWSLFLAKVVTILFGGKTYLWDCEYYEELPVNRWQRWAIRWTDVLVTGHVKIAVQYRKVLGLGSKEIRVVRNWVYLNSKFKVQNSKLERKEINILFLHHMSPRKGSRELGEIIASVLKIKKDIHFTIVGDGPDLPNLKFKIKNSKLGKKVTFRGQLNRKEVEEEWGKADLFIMPSRAEGFPRVILEAQTLGVPYISTDVGCVSEITPVGLQNLIVPVESFPEKIIEVLNWSAEKRQTVSRLLQRQAKPYNLVKASEEFVNVFK